MGANVAAEGGKGRQEWGGAWVGWTGLVAGQAVCWSENRRSQGGDTVQDLLWQSVAGGLEAGRLALRYALQLTAP